MMYWFIKIKHLQEILEIQNRKRKNPKIQTKKKVKGKKKEEQKQKKGEHLKKK